VKYVNFSKEETYKILVSMKYENFYIKYLTLLLNKNLRR